MSYLPSKRLYLRGLGRDVAPEELAQFLSPYGKINEVKFVHNYAFVEFESEADARLVFNIYRTTPLLGKDITIQFARPLRKDIAALQYDLGLKPQGLTRRPSSRGSVSRFPIVVMGIPEDIRWQQLKDFGRSTGCLVAYCDLDPSTPSNGFIEYFTKEDADYAIRTLDGRNLGGHIVRVVNYNEVSNERRRKGSSPFPPQIPAHGKASPSNGGAFHPWGYLRSSHTGYPSPQPSDEHAKYEPWVDTGSFGVRSPLATLPQAEALNQGQGSFQFVPQFGDRVQALNVDFTRQSSNDEDFLQYNPAVSCRLFDDFNPVTQFDYSNLRTTL